MSLKLTRLRLALSDLNVSIKNYQIVFAVSINPSLTPQSFTSDSEEVWRLRTRKYFNVQNFLKSWHPNVRIENKNLRKMSSIIVTCNKKPVECFIIHYLLSIKRCKKDDNPLVLHWLFLLLLLALLITGHVAAGLLPPSSLA